MADKDDEAARNQLRAYRETTANVVGELRSQEIRDTFAAITLSEVIEQHLTTLTGKGRIPSRKARLEKIHKTFNDSIEALKKTSPDSFRTPDPSRDVNTPVKPEE